MPDSPIKLVCFDIGGVMVRICRSWTEGCTRAGLPIREGAMEALENTKPLRRRLVHLYQTGRLDTDAYCRQVSAAVANCYHPAEIRSIHDAWLLEEYEGLGVVIDEVHATGMQTACLSNINAVHWDRMADYPAVMQLTHRFGSHLIGHHKPEPEIYEALETSLSLGGSQIIFFDDLEENIEAARHRGWHAVHIDHETPTNGQIRNALIEQGILKA